MYKLLGSISRLYRSANAKSVLNVPTYISNDSAPSYIASVTAYETAKQNFEENNIEQATKLVKIALEEANGISEESPATASYLQAVLKLRREIEEKIRPTCKGPK